MSLFVIVISIVIPAVCLVLSEILRKNSRQFSTRVTGFSPGIPTRTAP